MKSIAKIFIISAIVVFLSLFGISQYKHINVKPSPIYTTIYKSNAGVMTMGGMASDKNKIDSFKKDLEDDEFLNYLEASYNYEKKGDNQNAVIQGEKALEFAKSAGDVWQVRAGLATLYEKIGKYDLALKQYAVIIPIQEDALADSANKGYKLDVQRRQKLVDELKASRRRCEEAIAH